MNKVISRGMIVGALGEGLYLLIKYGLLIIVITYALAYLNDLRGKAENGNQAAIAINEYINKGWLPKFPVPVNPNNK